MSELIGGALMVIAGGYIPAYVNKFRHGEWRQFVGKR